jgi:hypothetical protein
VNDEAIAPTSAAADTAAGVSVALTVPIHKRKLSGAFVRERRLR